VQRKRQREAIDETREDKERRAEWTPSSTPPIDLEAVRREQHISVVEPLHERAGSAELVVRDDVHLPLRGEAGQGGVQQGQGLGVQVGDDSEGGRRRMGIRIEKQ
jgi:hypothetical protein